MIAVDFAFPGGLWMQVILVYAPSLASGASEVGQVLRQWLNNATNEGMTIIVCGDFNDVVDQQTDRIPSHQRTCRMGAPLEACISKGLVDSYHLLYLTAHVMSSMT